MSPTTDNISSPPLASCLLIKREVSATYPYYTPATAAIVRAIALDMIATADTDQRSRSIEAVKMNKSLATLEKVISRGALYLVDHDTTEGQIFRKWRQSVYIKKHYPSQCVMIEWKYAGLNVNLVESTKISHKPAPTKKSLMQDAIVTMSWQEGIDDFINNADEGTTLKIGDLRLTAEDMNNVRASLRGMESVVKIVEISYHKIILEK